MSLYNTVGNHKLSFIKIGGISFLIFVSFFTTRGWSQSKAILERNVNGINTYFDHHPTEKVHLHLDRSWYSLGDTIWFKAYTVNGTDHRLSNMSKILYAELINTEDTVVKRLILRLCGGTTYGEFEVPYSYRPGQYRIRAYTNVMRNDSEYFYDHRIAIGGVPPVLAKNVDQSAPDVQFFPESGYLVNGLRSRVAFKAINKNGLSVAVRGTIIDNDNKEVAIFNTQYAGMGEFPLTPEAGKHYKARIICPDGTMYTDNLPGARDNAFVLTVSNTVDSVYIKLAANEARLKSDTAFYLLALSDGRVCFTAASKLTGPVFTKVIAKSRFPSGITQFTLFSQSGEPLNERIAFIHNADSAKLTVSGNKDSYASGEKVKLNLEASTGRFSIAVTNETKAPADEQAESSIFADLLLTSELKGYIENPDHYFADNSEKTRSDLDLLLLTQGYRRFEWKKIWVDEPLKYQPDTALSLSGVIRTMGNKPIAGGSIRLTSIKDMFSTDTLSDSRGRFTFSNLDFNDSTKLVINAKKAKGGTSVIIAIDNPEYPKIGHLNDLAGVQTDSLSLNLSDALKRAYFTGKQLYLKNVIQLKEVKIKAKRKFAFDAPNTENMKFSANLNGPGNADQILLTDQIMRGGGGNLSDILSSKMPGVTWIGGYAFDNRYEQAYNPRKAMRIYVEGAEISPNMINDINASDIYSIEVLTSLTHLSIYGSNAPYGALIITLKHGLDPTHSALLTVDGLSTYMFNGFYEAREFYSPKYQVQDSKQSADDRSTVYWNPEVITTDGKGSIEYYNAGSPATYRVVIEGIGDNGSLYRNVLKYEVN